MTDLRGRTSMLRSMIGVVALLACVGCGACEPDDMGPDGDRPIQGEWETIIDQVVFIYDTDQAEALARAPVTYLHIGKAAGDNLVNRGHVEVIYSDDHDAVAVDGLGPLPAISVEIRKFTTAGDVDSGLEKLEDTKLYAYTVPPADSPPTEAMDSQWCVQDLGLQDANGDEVQGWSESCYLTVSFDGLYQPQRDGADIRVTVPSQWRGLVEIVTSDNIMDQATYPRRSNVWISDLAGEARVTLESGTADIRLAEEFLEVITCDEPGHQDCRNARWNTSDPGGCIDADGLDDDGHCSNVDECESDPECMVNSCFCDPDDFAAIQVKTHDGRAGDATVDMPSHLWANVRAQNNESSLSSDADPLCIADVRCEDFDSCDIDEDNSANVWKTYVELNDLGDDNVEGLGVQVIVQSDACAYVPVAHGPDDFEAPEQIKRGDLTVCNGCLADH